MKIFYLLIALTTSLVRGRTCWWPSIVGVSAVPPSQVMDAPSLRLPSKGKKQTKQLLPLLMLQTIYQLVRAVNLFSKSHECSLGIKLKGILWELPSNENPIWFCRIYFFFIFLHYSSLSFTPSSTKYREECYEDYVQHKKCAMLLIKTCK